MKPNQVPVTNDEMQAIEFNSAFLGASHSQLMEAVGSQVARVVVSKVQEKENPTISILSGPGKNGGDGFSTARHLASQGYAVKVTLVGKRSDVTDHAATHQLKAILGMNETITFQSCQDSTQLTPFESDIIIDALLGTGVKGDLHQPILGAVQTINKSKGYKVSIDLPSGLDTDTGKPHGDAVKADLTICLHRLKKGLAKTSEYSREIIVIPIGIPPEAESCAGPGDFKVLWNPRPSEAHKGDYGRLLVIGGSENFTGAPTYAALAATRLGTDLVYVASPEPTATIIANYSPELITIRLPDTHLTAKALPKIDPWLRKADAVIIGPGIGLNEETHEAVWKLIAFTEKQSKPIVIDADALKIFSNRRRRLKTPTVLTPHIREFALLAHKEVGHDMNLRREEAINLARDLSATIILKGRIDIIAEAKRAKLNKTGNPYMTVGGTGDVLTGIVGAFLAQHVDPFQASVAAAFLNGLAGDILISEKGPAMTPTELLDYLPKAMKYCTEGPPYPRL